MEKVPLVDMHKAGGIQRTLLSFWGMEGSNEEYFCFVAAGKEILGQIDLEDLPKPCSLILAKNRIVNFENYISDIQILTKHKRTHSIHKKEGVEDWRCTLLGLLLIRIVIVEQF